MNLQIETTMKRFCYFFLMAFAILYSGSVFAGSRIVTDTISSKVLGADVVCNIYLPDGYDASKSYPVIYLLHGLTNTYSAWAEKGNMKLVADELMETGECVPAVIVMPNAGNPDVHKVWNGYFNMEGWSYEDFFFTEFLPWVETRYNAGGSKGRRAVMGLSMGGGGSVVYCQRHPDKFSSCYAMSAWLDDGDREVGDVNEAKKDKLYHTYMAVREHSALNFVRNADEATLESLRTVKWFIDCGDDDFLFDLSVGLHQLMRDRKVKDELTVRNGVHNWEYWHQALRIALPFASRNFSCE